MTPDIPLILAGIGVMLAVPLTFMFANWVRKNVDYGEARFDAEGNVIDDKEKRGPTVPATKKDSA